MSYILFDIGVYIKSFCYESCDHLPFKCTCEKLTCQNEPKEFGGHLQYQACLKYFTHWPFIVCYHVYVDAARFSATLQKGENNQLCLSQDVRDKHHLLPSHVSLTTLIKSQFSLTSDARSEGKRFAPVSPLPEVPLGAAADLNTVVLIRVQV